MAGALAVELAGGPHIELIYGRIDAPASYQDDETYRKGSPLATRLPTPVPPYPDGAPSADVHVRNIFFRMGFTSREIVALCGAHTIGRAFKDRSGVCPYFSGDQGATKYTRQIAIAKVD
jgi:L-ascorbate peroxidase